VVLFAIVNAFISDASAQANQVQGSKVQEAQDDKQVYSGVVFGPVGQNDTLWRIASRYKQDSPFSVFQTMLAIFELNQQSFENGNFNTMVNGATLLLPSDRYIAQIDLQRARAKAASDERALAPRPSASSGQAPVISGGAALAEQTPSIDVKSKIPPFNQEDLSITSVQLPSQLDGLRQQQQRQFEQLKRQVSTSVSAIELLLEENKKLSNQLLQLDENNQALTQKVESELQNQINLQLEQLSQLVTQVTDAENRRIDQESESLLSVLSSPLALIIIMSMVALLIMTGFALFLLRKPSQASQKGDAKSAQDIVNEDTFQEDDILSGTIEDDDVLNVLPDVDLQEVLDDLDALLVPDSPSQIFDTESKSDEGSSQAVQLDSQHFFDENIDKLDLSESQTISLDKTAKAAEDASDESTDLRYKGTASELPAKEKSVESDLSNKNFVDVDELLEESDAMALMSDSDKRLDLNSALGRLNTKQDDEFNMPDIGIESDQASNLDLAQVYMDMEDFEAAQELLDEVIRLGDMEQQEEAKALLVDLNK
jgi:pilus assembly protein FimV